MTLQNIFILNFKNIQEATLSFSDKINCFVGLNGQGKTNLLDAIYYLSFTKSAFNSIDSQNIHHDADFAMIQGEYLSAQQSNSDSGLTLFSCGLYRGRKKQFRRGKKDYQRLQDHIGLIPLVMVSPADQELILDGSEARRKFMDGVISQYNRQYLDQLTQYNALLKQRNALLKQIADTNSPQDGLAAQRSNSDSGLLEVFDLQLAPLAEGIFRERTAFIERFIPLFQDIYTEISGGNERVTLRYISQLQDRNLAEAYVRTRQRDLILGWTSQGIHKDDLDMFLGEYPLKQVASQGQQKTYLLAMKLAQAVFLGKPILLLDDIFDKLDNERVARIVRLVRSDRFGQIFVTDTDRQHLTDILRSSDFPTDKIFFVSNGQITTINNYFNVFAVKLAGEMQSWD